tara:strand:+ start:625 stop:879 length:255 start_codon:yes stop_codon:yes gene_type:complete
MFNCEPEDWLTGKDGELLAFFSEDSFEVGSVGCISYLDRRGNYKIIDKQGYEREFTYYVKPASENSVIVERFVVSIQKEWRKDG